jgi:adenylate cyclase
MAMPRFRFAPGAAVGAVGTVMLALLLMVWLLADGGRSVLRERSLDALLPLVVAPAAPSDTPEIVVVDIDRDSLSSLGAWPWPRARLAQLVATVAGAAPRVMAVDILLAEPDRLSPAALVRALAATTGRSNLGDLAAGFPDADTTLAEALAAVPAALGFALDPESAGSALPPTPILLRDPVELPAIWRAAGVVAPTQAVAAGAQGFGTLALAADADGLVRRVPLLVFAGGTTRPGLAVETLRLSEEAGALIVGPSAILGVGMITAPLDADAALRLVPRPAEWWSTHRISAGALHHDPALARSIIGRIVLIGGSAPELGGLRATPASPVTPSVLIQATAIDMLLRGPLLHRPACNYSASE